MEKIIAFFAIILIGFTPAFTQTPVIIKHSFEPETTCRKTIITRQISKIELSSTDDETMDFSEFFGENPLTEDKSTRMEATVRPGKMDSEGNIPLTMILIVPESDSPQSLLFNGSGIFGTYTFNEKVILDFLVSPSVPEELLESVLDFIRSIIDQVGYPKESFEIGETIEEYSTIAAPIGHNVINVSTISEYTLKSVRNGLALFDINISGDYAGITLTMPDIIYGDYRGKGSFKYDIEKKRVAKSSHELNSIKINGSL